MLVQLELLENSNHRKKRGGISVKKVKIILAAILISGIFLTNVEANTRSWTGKTITYSGTTVATGLTKPSISTSSGTITYCLETTADWINIYFDFYNEEGNHVGNQISTAYKGKGAYSSYSFTPSFIMTTGSYTVKAKRQNIWDSGLISNGSIKL